MEKYAVIPDLHGQTGKLHAVTQHYKREGVQFLSLGDVLDGGENPKECVQTLQDVDAIMLLANHEMMTLAAIQEGSEPLLVEAWLRRYESKTLESYGVGSSENPAEALRESMQALGHLAFLETAPPYFETPDFIAIHAGLDDRPWQEQKAELDQVGENRLAGDYSDAPEQIFDLDFKLSTQVSTAATDKIVVSGHAHNRTTALDNYVDATKRIKLASSLYKGLPLFVWESWTGNVVPF